MAVSVATLRVLEERTGRRIDQMAAFVAGHSLGEYSALAAAGAFSVAEAAQLLKRRGQAMQQAVPAGVGAMAALLGPARSQAHEGAADAAAGEVCPAAHDNPPGQGGVRGPKAAGGSASSERRRWGEECGGKGSTR